ncbi:hypothetical protein C0Q70_08090 [Pomacea canaliculata]|uniref:Uncharacterized protein n=1 Tax=Pomacea canaliculata TaxID=400727 RepID=A0A2T7PGU2_POMCA|nr:hypothetical protein C0Q70_08090 [Pomacea canaliculata]
MTPGEAAPRSPRRPDRSVGTGLADDAPEELSPHLSFLSDKWSDMMSLGPGAAYVTMTPECRVLSEVQVRATGLQQTNASGNHALPKCTRLIPTHTRMRGQGHSVSGDPLPFVVTDEFSSVLSCVAGPQSAGVHTNPGKITYR